MLLYLPPYTDAWVNADTGELSIRVPYKVIDWEVERGNNAKHGNK